MTDLDEAFELSEQAEKEKHYEKVRELSESLKKQKARCDRYCGTWNSEDKDCEIYGDYHPSPAKCKYFLECELERRK